MAKGSNGILLQHAQIYLEDKNIEKGDIYIKDGKIQSISIGETLQQKDPKDVFKMDASGLNAIPGFIDTHIHGANGADTMDATEDALDQIASFLPQEGTTSFLATTITQSPTNISRALKNVAKYENKPGQAEMIGVHLEGPFVNEKKAGAQPKKYITKPNIEQFKQWQEQSGGKIKTITLAPEQDGKGEFINYLVNAGVNVSAGHTDATFTEMKKAAKHGVSQLTHLCNAMNGIHHRDIGAVGAAFLLKDVKAELIADGIHVSPEMLHLIYQNLGSERIILITDAMRAKGLPYGKHELGGQPVFVKNGKAVLEDGTLAGSVLRMNEAAKQMLEIPGVTIHAIVEMASVNPAKQIGIYKRKGSITPGKDADILLVDNECNIRYTLCRGEIVYSS